MKKKGPRPKKKQKNKKNWWNKKNQWVKVNKRDFHSLIQDVYNNLNNNELKTTADKKTYDFKNARKILVKILNIDDYNPSTKRKKLIVFDNTIADIIWVTKNFKP